MLAASPRRSSILERLVQGGVSDRRALGQQVRAVVVSEQTWRRELFFEMQHDRSSSIYTRPAAPTKRRNSCMGAALSKPRSRWARVSLRRLFSVHLRLVDQFLQSRVDGFFAGGADPFVPDHALGIEDVVARRAGVPFGVDRILMRERPPVHFLLVHSFL